MSGAVPVGEEIIAYANSQQIRPGQIFNLSDLGLLVVYDARFKDSKIYGFIGGSEKLSPTKAVFNHTRTAESCFNCPRCEAPVVAGQLICFSCSTIYLFEGRDRLYSPILREFVEVMPKTKRPPIRISASKIARAIEHGGNTSQRSIRSAISRLFEDCICYQARWVSDGVATHAERVEYTEQGRNRPIEALESQDWATYLARFDAHTTHFCPHCRRIFTMVHQSRATSGPRGNQVDV